MNLLELPTICIYKIFKYFNPAQLAVLRATAKAFHPYINSLAKSKNKLTIEDWVRYGSFHIIKLLQKNIELSSQLAKYGHLEMLQWVRANGCPWDENTCGFAARSGYLNILKWLRANGYPWDEATCAIAAMGGHLDVLKWARKNGCPWDKNTSLLAALGGYLKILIWAKANGCPWDEWTCSYAASSGYLNVLEWVRNSGCPE